MTFPLLFLLTLFCSIVLVTSNYRNQCGKQYVSRGPLCCRPIFNCHAGHEIKPCTKAYEEETCVPCAKGMVQSNLIHSLDNERTCFDKETECSANDITYSRLPRTNCHPKRCKCKVDSCFVEENCVCNKKTSCGLGNYLDPIKKVCTPCNDYSYKLHEGCSRCLVNETLWLRQFQVVGKLRITENRAKITSEKSRTLSSTTLSLEMENGTLAPLPKSTEGGNISTFVVILAAAIAFVILVIAIVIFCYMLYRMHLEKEKPIIPESRPLTARSSTSTDGSESSGQPCNCEDIAYTSTVKDSSDCTNEGNEPGDITIVIDTSHVNSLPAISATNAPSDQPDVSSSSSSSDRQRRRHFSSSSNATESYKPSAKATVFQNLTYPPDSFNSNHTESISSRSEDNAADVSSIQNDDAESENTEEKEVVGET